MSTESHQPDKTVIQSSKPADVSPATGSAPWPANYPPADEIDLVDLGVMLWRRWRVMLVVFLVFLALTIVGTIIKSPSYSYTTSLQLGSTLVQSTGNVTPLMSAPTVAETMQNTYIPQAIGQTLSHDGVQDPSTARVPKVAASGTAGGDSVMLSCKAKVSESKLCVAIESIAVENFISNNSQFSTGAKNKLASLQAQAKVLQVQMDKLDASSKLFQQQEADLEKQISRMQQSGLQAARGANNGSAALSNLILNTEVQRATDTLATVRQQLEVAIPQQRAQITQQLSDNANDQQLQQQNISLGFARMVNPGLRSINPVGLSRWAVLGLGAIISIILAIGAALLTVYVEQVRARLSVPAQH